MLGQNEDANISQQNTINKYIMKNHTVKILEYLDDHGLDIFTKDQVLSITTIPQSSIMRGVKELIDLGYLKVIEKGKYCRHNFADEFVIGTFLVKKGAIAYWSAMNYHGLTEQIPNTVFVQTNQWKIDKKIFGVHYKFIQVSEYKLMGYQEKGYGNSRFSITDVEKTLVDSFDRPENSGGYPEIIKAFNKAQIKPLKLKRYCKAFNKIAITKRLAYLTELFGKTGMDDFIDYALSVRNNNYDPFWHYQESKGKINERWRLILNIDEKEILNMRY